MENLKELVKDMQAKNDWIGIYERFRPIIELRSNGEHWNNADLLSSISFATAKLSETNINLKYAFKDESEKAQFLNQQKSYRDATILLRKRCVELNPQSATYFSNLGYSHYQHLRELMQPGGRRDGKAIAEAEAALENFDNALKINPKRINDLYRKGQILSELYPKLTLFSKATLVDKEKSKSAAKQANEKIKAGIGTFKQAIECWEQIPLNDEFARKKSYKDYVKCHYDIARAYSDLIQNNWDEIQFVLSLDYGIKDSDKVSFIPEDLENIENAIKAIHRCCKADNIPSLSQKPSDEIALAAQNGVVEGVFKLYSYGKYLFLKYWILSGYGQRSNEKADNCRNWAEKFFIKALEFDWSDEKAKQDKLFIVEKLARLYISQKNYGKAMGLLEKHLHKKRRVDYYINYTLAVAYINLGLYDKAKSVLDNALSDTNGNKEAWLGHFLKSCSDLRKGDLEHSKKSLDEATRIAKSNGKENLDSLLIAQGFIEYKQNNKVKALEFIKKANEINPYRVAVKKFEEKWSKN